MQTEAREFRVFGSPGTGKTTYLTSQIQAAANKYGADRLFVASFTKAAAHEVAGRNQNIQNVGTLHAHGYRSIGGTLKVAEAMIKEWNEDHPEYMLSDGKQSDVDEVSEAGTVSTAGDELYTEMQLKRALMVPRNLWPVAVQAFARRWEDWKKARGIIDYTDMIEIPYRDVDAPPGNPSVGFFDECQDFTPLEMALVRKWGRTLDYIILAGDDDQCIYEWAGARPDVLIDGEPAKKVVLKQSYRVPRAIHAVAMREILTVTKREPKEYRPRDEDGEVRYLRGVNSTMPEMIIRDIETRYKDKRIMILASCSYMLHNIIHALRMAGIPFANPYRPKNGAWNPLRRSTRDHTSTIDRLLSYIDMVPVEYREPDGDWEYLLDAGDFLKWYEILKVNGNIPKGTRDDRIKELKTIIANDGELLLHDVWRFFEEKSGIWDYWGNPARLLEAVDWLIKNSQADKARAMEFPRRIIERRGVQALKDEPRIILGTIHSVKGGEADVVYVIPDLSYGAYQEKESSIAGRDAVKRLKYVAYTRARESLVLLDGATNLVM